MRIRANKIASVTRSLDLGYELFLSGEIASRPGAVIAGRVLNDKRVYDTLEDVHGRMSKVKSGDVIVGALGHRWALHGYEGVVPDSVSVGETVALLNLGGVMGVCTSYNPEVGPPINVEVLGQVLLYPVFQSREGVPAFITNDLGEKPEREFDVPLVVVCGACMNSGKTAAASAVISGLTRAGLNVGGAKLTGVSLMRDILSQRDYGAACAYDFTDVGFPSTDADIAPIAARRIFNLIASDRPDVVVAEMGDGIFGKYGVQEILADAAIAEKIAVLIYCANDPAGAFGGVLELRERYGLDADVISGPVTDNLVGSRFVRERLGIAAANARREPDDLCSAVLERINGKIARNGGQNES